MEKPTGTRFDFQRLDVYRAAIRFAGWRRQLLKRLSATDGDVADQIRRASTSIALNIAEGCGEFSLPERRRFYRMARRSAAECAAVLDVFEELEFYRGEALEDGRVLLDRIIAMLTAMIGRLPSRQKRKAH